MDIITYSLAKNKAKKYTDEVVEGLGRGILYKGAVNYYNDLPNNAAIGDCYSVLYEGTSGSTPSGAEYIWGKVNDAAAAEWIQLGKDIDLTDYVKNTDYATSSKGGTLKVDNGLGTGVSQYGVLVGIGKTYPQYNSAYSDLIISKGTLDNVITGKGLVSNTDYANSTTGGVIVSANSLSINSAGQTYCQIRDYATYQTISNSHFISKGTLDNVLNARIGDIQTLLDNLDIGSGV